MTAKYPDQWPPGMRCLTLHVQTALPPCSLSLFPAQEGQDPCPPPSMAPLSFEIMGVQLLYYMELRSVCTCQISTRHAALF